MRDAIVRLQQLEEYTRNAMLAFVAPTWAQRSCSDRHLQNMIDKALKAVRDNCVWRVQMTVTCGHRDAFLEELVRANGGPVSQEMQAQFLHSHSKTICQYFLSAFLSNGKMRRRAPRPPRTNNRGCEVSSEDDDYPVHVEPLGSGWGVYFRNLIGQITLHGAQ
jgi:hypothetical protein